MCKGSWRASLVTERKAPRTSVSRGARSGKEEATKPTTENLTLQAERTKKAIKKRKHHVDCPERENTLRLQTAFLHCMKKFKSKLWNSFPRRAGALGCWLLWLAMVIGMPQLQGRPKDRSVPYPCMDHACGCRDAEECWRHCCCLSREQKWAWAQEHQVEPPLFAQAEWAAQQEKTAKLDRPEQVEHSCCHPTAASAGHDHASAGKEHDGQCECHRESHDAGAASGEAPKDRHASSLAFVKSGGCAGQSGWVWALVNWIAVQTADAIRNQPCLESSLKIILLALSSHSEWPLSPPPKG
jgi:hypothetical protein